MGTVLIVGHATRARRWETAVLEHLQPLGHRIVMQSIGEAPRHRGLDCVLAFEGMRFGPSLAGPGNPLPGKAEPAVDLIVDLTGRLQKSEKPTLSLELLGHTDLIGGVTAMLAGRLLPEFILRRDGVAVGVARPMVSDKLWLTRMLNETFSGAMSLIEQGVRRHFDGDVRVLDDADCQPASASTGFLGAYVSFACEALASRIAQKLRKRATYWQVAYRRHEGPGAAETCALDGPPFDVLPDDGDRFYADPFVISVEGRHYLFVEEYPYATRRGVISVAAMDENGRFARPKVVLEEPHHLSYPQVFLEDGGIFMIPESGSAREVTLYRAEDFPDRWVRDSVLIAGRNLNDMTLLKRDGRHWLFGTEKSAFGSASDTMVVFSAPELRGPWHPHPANPIAIDRAGARPGGAFIHDGEKILLPVQDGTHQYGGGLGLMELIALDEKRVEFGRPVPVRPGAAFSDAGIHTLNRVAGVEVVDRSA